MTSPARLLAPLVCALLFACSSQPVAAQDAQNDAVKERLEDPNWLAPFVSTPAPVVHALLELANVSARDRLYDLGSGDGRIILAAAQDFQAASVGIEWDQALCDKVTSAIKTLGLQDRVTVIQGDIFDQDLRPATVITGYLLPKSWERLAPILRQQLKPGARVVTVNHPITGWQTVATKHLDDESSTLSWDLYLYRIGP